MQSAQAPRRVIIVGTGTGVGKTHVGCAVLRRLRARGTLVVGLKPVETGLAAGSVSDHARLQAAAAGIGSLVDDSEAFHVKRSDRLFHVKPSPYWFGPPLSPHLAAREAGQRIDLACIRSWVLGAQGARASRIAVVETAGGLFSPLDPAATNLDLVAALRPASTVLVAPDRLGVLHEVTAALGLAAARGHAMDAVALSQPETPDRSTGRNADELARLQIAVVRAVFPWASESAAATEDQADRLLRWLFPSAPA